MEAAIWYFIYCAAIAGVMIFYKVTTRQEREWLLWHTITILTLLVIPAYFIA